ncbi:type I restriction endonuclease subunit R [Aerococcaceae bacterium DSM 111020]|nr:type I restriction endonuclease subunit R [Aerococcaceae bacterium DSM 111020]
MQFESEARMEQKIIDLLTREESKWNYCPELNTEQKLWDNFFYYLELHNIQRLNGTFLTEQEKHQIKNQLNFTTFYDAAVWLRGENGVAKVDVQREDASLGKVRLNVINSQEIAGGDSVYQIINQFQSDKKSPQGQSHRFDLTLMINGIPLIHFELKNRRESFINAFNQVKRYLEAGKFTGIFSAIQMFVVSNGTDTRYIAAASKERLKETFLTRWVDPENEPVNNYLEFSANVLTIPEAHHMVANYSVLDKDRKSIILLRPYQIHAIESVKQATKTQQSGYVWHTTGSGKTLTSYKVARNLLQIPSIDKSIFVVDRKDLNLQTSEAFLSYAENDVIDVNDSENVYDLMKKLVSTDRTLIVTTIQKLNILIKRLQERDDSDPQKKKIQSLRVSFVVDECHRAVTPQQQQIVNEFFQYPMWYGFTGTPIFKENARAAMGDLARTTEQQYGECLHQYTVKEAINDKAVLAFQVEYKSTIDEDQLDHLILEQNPGTNVNQMTLIEKEAMIDPVIYENDEHRLQVIDSIINRSQSKLGLNKGPGNSYSAIFTTNSIRNAQRYYELFQEVIRGESPITIREQVKKYISDFPKIAITYSVGTNEDGADVNQEKMWQSIQDYNEMFGMSFSMENIDSYNKDVNNRLARKAEVYQNRSEQLDLVIVVDRLLTGFDAPSLSTLFMDRPPMKPQHLIQAFSRTNRIYDKDKQYGQIVTFQLPETYKESVREAFVLYSNGGEDFIQAPSWAESLYEFEEAWQTLQDIAPTPESVDSLTSEAEKRKFAKAFQVFDKAYAVIQVYSDYDKEQFEHKYHYNNETLEDYNGKYVNIIEELRNDTEVEQLELDIEYQIQSIHNEKIDYDYLLNLMEISRRNEKAKERDYRDSDDAKQIEKYIADLSKSKPELAKVVQKVWQEYLEAPELYEDKTFPTVINQYVENYTQQSLHQFADEWKVDLNDLDFFVDNYDIHRDRQIGESDLLQRADYDEYKSVNPNGVKKLRYNKSIREESTKMVIEEILPFKTD